MRTIIQKGLCPKCAEKGIDGFLQYDKVGEIVYCKNCMWRISEYDFEAELEEAFENEYHTPDELQNLSELNNL